MKRQEHFQPENVVSAYKRALALKGPSIFPGASILILRRGAPFSDKTGYDLERGAQRPCAEPACCAKRDCAERRHGTMQGRIQDLVNEGGGKRPFVGGTEVCHSLFFHAKLIVCSTKLGGQIFFSGVKDPPEPSARDGETLRISNESPRTVPNLAGYDRRLADPHFVLGPLCALCFSPGPATHVAHIAPVQQPLCTSLETIRRFLPIALVGGGCDCDCFIPSGSELAGPASPPPPGRIPCEVRRG